MFVDYDMLDACLTSCNRERLDSIGIPRNEVILDKVPDAKARERTVRAKRR